MISHKIAVHQLIDVCTTRVVRPTNLYLQKTSPKYSNDFYYIFRGLLLVTRGSFPICINIFSLFVSVHIPLALGTESRTLLSGNRWQ